MILKLSKDVADGIVSRAPSEQPSGSCPQWAVEKWGETHLHFSDVLSLYDHAVFQCSRHILLNIDVSFPRLPPKVLLLCRSWGACVTRRSYRLCQLEFWLLVGTTMLDRHWARGQNKCNTPLMLATSVFGRIHRRPCYVMAQPKSRLDIPWPNDAECMGHIWYHFSCWYPLLFDVESLAGCVGG